jgi:hypothetical protein
MSSFPLRLPSHVMDDVKTLSFESKVSVNQFIASLIAERVGDLKARRMIKERASRADLEAARRAIAHAKTLVVADDRDVSDWDRLERKQNEHPPRTTKRGR